ncbi:MAG: HD domain-containing protein [Candidatus Eremiobacteraeota bacterium]|nr:HD domain-containing protein [Candidatus Eremiobacteraeota bacterium]MCW5867764.1 HD domain-containing protein [Candidatus Eremiobacteraeota bacterium]
MNGQPLEVGGAARLARSGEAAAQSAATANGSLPALVLRYFTVGEWARLNPGHYHDQEHPVHVANTVAEVAGNLGRSPERAEFLQQVALLHDVDERIGQSSAVSPARAPVTLEWMDRNQEALGGRFGWNSADFAEAKALIARTDFPFDEKPKNLSTRYDGQSPIMLYQNLLAAVPEERRQQTMEDGLILRFADQTGNYTVDAEQSARYIAGLGDEMRGVGINITNEQLAKGSPDFLRAAGLDMAEDWKIADDLAVPSGDFATRDILLGALSPNRREAFLALQKEGHSL